MGWIVDNPIGQSLLKQVYLTIKIGSSLFSLAY
jgi:hypothetical protein